MKVKFPSMELVREITFAPVPTIKTFNLNLDEFPAGVSVSCVLPPIFDSTPVPSQSGIRVCGAHQDGYELDQVFSGVRILGSSIRNSSFRITGQDGLRHAIRTIVQDRLRLPSCPRCRRSYLWSEGITRCDCGHIFHISSDPIGELQKALCAPGSTSHTSRRILRVNSDDVIGGLMVRLTGPSIVSTRNDMHEEGLIVGRYDSRKQSVIESLGVLNGIEIEGAIFTAEQAHCWFAQRILRHLLPVLLSMRCPKCLNYHFDRERLAISPHRMHQCEFCGHRFVVENGRRSISNPIHRLPELLRLDWQRRRYLSG